MSNSDVYKRMIECTIKEYGSVTNQGLVIRFANQVSGLKVDKNGKVKSGANLDNFVALVNHVKKFFGPVAYFLARKSVKKVLEDIRNELPKELR